MFIRLTVRVFSVRLSNFMLEGGMWDVIVSIPEPFYLPYILYIINFCALVY